MHVVLSTAPRGGGAIERTRVPYLGLACCAATVEREGMRASVVDPHCLDLDAQSAASRILSLQPDLVGVVCLSHNRMQALEMLQALRHQSSVPIVVGGYHFSHTAEDALNSVPAIDFVCHGEGELTLPALMKALHEGRDPATVKGLYVRDDAGRPHFTGHGAFPMNLDELPDPAWHLYDIPRYDRCIDGTRIRSFGVMSSRGCPSACVFCADALTRLRLRSPERFVSEVEWFVQEHNVRGFDFWDDTMTMNQKHVLAICDEIMRRNLDIVWYCRARVNGLNPELLQRMYRAGCHYISFGVESGSPRILRLIKKKITLDHVRAGVRMALDASMQVRCNFIVSHPDETEADLIQSMRFMRELERMDPRVQCDYAIMTIFPGTALEHIAKEKGLLPVEFSWNTPVTFPKAILAGLPPSLPYYEQDLPLERIRAIVLRERNPPGQAIRKAVRRLRRVRTRDDAVAFARAGARYFASLIAR